MGYPAEEARGALRFSLGRTTTAAEVAEAADLIVRALARQREAGAGLDGRAKVVAARPSVPSAANPNSVAEASLE
jgi:cysteine desulfurase